MKTLADYQAACLALSKAQSTAAAVQAEQEAERAAAAATLARLNAELAPHRQKVKQAQEQVDALRARLIGPWVIDKARRWFSGTMYTGTGEKAWFNRRVWLRVVSRDQRDPQWQWEVDIDPLNGEGPRAFVVLGPPDGSKSSEEDFDTRRRVVEKMLTERGWVILEVPLEQGSAQHLAE